MTTITQPIPQSAGHICFSAGQEFYEISGDVYRANLDSVFDVLTGARIGRWECSRAHFERFRSILVVADQAGGIPPCPAPSHFSSSDDRYNTKLITTADCGWCGEPVVVRS